MEINYLLDTCDFSSKAFSNIVAGVLFTKNQRSLFDNCTSSSVPGV